MVLTEEEAVELLALLVTSARIQVDEQARYGPLRLLTTAERLSGFIRDRASAQAQPMLEVLLSEIPEMAMYMSDNERYTAALEGSDKIDEELEAMKRQLGKEG